jgi:hypothetical protein
MAPSIRCEVIPLSEVPREETAPEIFEEPRQPLVLIVDDEPIVADTLGIVLTKAGFETLTAYSPIAALEWPCLCRRRF